MATRSLIGIVNENNSVQVIYCHWDGYPEYVGLQLQLNYRDEKVIRELIAMGDRSSLTGAPDVENTHLHTQGTAIVETVYESMQKFYEADKAGAEYAYLWSNANGWNVYQVWADGDMENLGQIDSIKLEYKKEAK